MINVDLAIFQAYLDLEAGDNQSLKIQVARPGIEPRSSAPEVYSDVKNWLNIFLSKVERSRFDGADLFASILNIWWQIHYVNS